MQKEEFDALRPRLLLSLTEKSIEMAELVMVGQRSQIEVAKEYGTTRQNVSLVLQRAKALIEGLPPDWVKLEEWMPKPMAVEIRQRLVKLRAEYAAQQRDKSGA